jgi:hypothetical protein
MSELVLTVAKYVIRLVDTSKTITDNGVDFVAETIVVYINATEMVREDKTHVVVSGRPSDAVWDYRTVQFSPDAMPEWVRGIIRAHIPAEHAHLAGAA